MDQKLPNWKTHPDQSQPSHVNKANTRRRLAPRINPQLHFISYFGDLDDTSYIGESPHTSYGMGVIGVIYISADA